MWNRHFVLLWQGLTVSQIGTQLFSLALLYWILETTGSATLMGLVLMAASLPGALLGPFGGTVADNLSRKHLIVGADVVRGLAGIAFVMTLWHGEADWALPMLFAAQVISGIAGAVFTPAVNASIPELVPKERLASANALIQGTNSVTHTASFGLGGFLYAALGAPWLFFINALSYLASALTECFITIRQAPPKIKLTRSNAVSKIWGDTIEGLAYVRAHRGALILVCMLGLSNFVLVPTSIAIPIFVRDFLGRGPEFLGIMGASQAFGSVVGFVVAGTIKVPPSQRPLLVLGTLTAVGVLVGALGLVTQPLLTLPLLACFGLLLPIANVNIISLLQGTTPSAMRGRVMGVMGTVVLGSIPISQGLSGLLIDLVNQQIPAVYVSIGALFAIIVLTASLNKTFRTYLATDYAK